MFSHKYPHSPWVLLHKDTFRRINKVLPSSSRAKRLVMFSCCGANLTLLILTQFQLLNCALGNGWFIPSHYNKDVNHYAFSSQSLHSCILTALRMMTEFELISNLQSWVGMWHPVGLSDVLRDVLWLKSSRCSITLTDNTLVNWKTDTQVWLWGIILIWERKTWLILIQIVFELTSPVYLWCNILLIYLHMIII